MLTNKIYLNWNRSVPFFTIARIKSIFKAVVLLLFALSSRGEQKPNILLIISDDQGWTDYGFMGHPEIQTPHLDRLASESLLFKRCYVASPLCRPSLASIATGLFPFDHGATGNDVFGYDDRAGRDVAVQEAFHHHPSMIKTLVEYGYLAHQSGKWWEGSWRDAGFTHGMTHGDPERKGRHGDEGLAIGRKDLKPITGFIDLAISQEKPFFVWYAPFLPHTPHNPPKRLLRKYQRSGHKDDVSKYYAMCEWFDETCGQLIDYLDEKGIRENTLVLYIADNGWRARSENEDDPNQMAWERYALRSKGSPYEYGVRTPIMLSWPSRIKPRRQSGFAHAVDFFPTIAAAAGVDVPNGLAGINLLDSSVTQDRDIIFGVTHSIQDITIGNPDRNLQYLWCVSRDWKLILRYPGIDTTRFKAMHEWDKPPARLYNLALDSQENKDLAESRPEIVAKLRKRIHNWYQPAELQ